MTTPSLPHALDAGAKSPFLEPAVARYLAAHARPDPLLRALIDETRRATGASAVMQIAPEQGPLLALVCRLVGARRAIEVGTFTGYSALCIARALPAGGSLLTIDRDASYTDIARRYWEVAGVAGRIELRLGDAGELLRALPAAPQFDLAFLDADKPHYRAHYEQLLARLRPGGVIVVDNVLWGGRVAQPDTDDAWARAIHAFNEHVAADPRVDVAMLSVGDGVTIARKR